MRDTTKVFGGFIGFFVVIALLIVFIGSWTIINPGEVGVVVRLGSLNRTLQQGFHWKVPLIESVDKTSIQTQKEQEEADAASSDLQNVNATIAVNWNVDATKVADLYTRVGDGFQTSIIAPAVQEVVKAVTANYTAEELITKRPQVTQDIQTQLATKLALNDIQVTSVSIVNFAFSDDFNNAVEAKVTAQQNALAAQNKLQQVQFEADQAIAEAKGQAQAIAIQAQAIQNQGGTAYLQLQAIQKWDGKMPTYMTPNAALPFIGNSTQN